MIPDTFPGSYKILCLGLDINNPTAAQARIRARDKGFSQTSAHSVDKSPTTQDRTVFLHATQPPASGLGPSPVDPLTFSLYTLGQQLDSSVSQFPERNGLRITSLQLLCAAQGGLGTDTLVSCCGAQSTRQLQAKFQLRSCALKVMFLGKSGIPTGIPNGQKYNPEPSMRTFPTAELLDSSHLAVPRAATQFSTLVSCTSEQLLKWA